MTLAVVSSGTASLSSATVTTLATITSGKTLVFTIDVSGLVSTNSLEVAVYSKILSGSTAKTVIDTTVTGNSRTSDLLQLGPFPCNQYFRVDVTSSSTLSPEWSVLSID
jgi:hypothetical protein